MSDFSALFELDSIGGFPDFVFDGLSTDDTLNLFKYVCATFGQTEPLVWGDLGLDYDFGDLFKSVLPCIDYDFKPLTFCGVDMQQVCMRLEDDLLLIDLQSGRMDHWNVERQTAFLKWLKHLCERVPQVQLKYCTEGSAPKADTEMTELLHQALNSV